MRGQVIEPDKPSAMVGVLLKSSESECRFTVRGIDTRYEFGSGLLILQTSIYFANVLPGMLTGTRSVCSSLMPIHVVSLKIDHKVSGRIAFFVMAKASK
jgi:hypothetical protein